MKTYCLKCGTEHSEDKFPKSCKNCRHEMYVNPIPVAVVIIPVKGKGLLVIKRAIPPQVGKYAFVSGFVDEGETIEAAAVREVKEETGLEIKSEFKILGIQNSTNKKNMMVFLLANEISLDGFKFVPNNESSEMQVLSEEIELAFSSHNDYFKVAKEVINKDKV